MPEMRGRWYPVPVIAAIVAIGLVTLSPALFVALDLRTYDLLAERVATATPSDRVAIVAIDDRSLQAIGQWPWPRERVAMLVERLRTLGASVIALDLLLAEPDRTVAAPESTARQTSDERLAQTIERGDVVIGYALRLDEGGSAADTTPLRPLPATLIERSGALPIRDQLFRASGCICPLPLLSERAGPSGFLNVALDADGTLRRVPLAMTDGARVYPSLALAAVQAARPSASLRLESQPGRSLRLGVDEGDIPLGERGTMMLRYPDPRHPMAHTSAADVLNGSADAAAIVGRIVFVGATAAGLRDAVSTPFDRQFPGVNVQATAAATLVGGRFIAEAPRARAWEALAAFALVLATGWVVHQRGLRSGVALGTGLVLGAWVACALALGWWGWYLSPLMPSAAVVFTVAGLAATRIRAEQHRAETEARRRRQAQDFITKSLTGLVEIRDRSTGQHARRTQTYSRLLMTRAARMPEFRDELTPDRIELLSLLAPLHDVGKVGIRDAVLNKPGKLTDDEMAEMQRHPIYGYDTLERAERQAGLDHAFDRDMLQLAKDIVYTHHERWDGLGYPRGLSGYEIPVAGRIMAVVDVYDALVETRPYRRRMDHREAVALIASGRGTQFDPHVVEAFLDVSSDFEAFGQQARGAESAAAH